MADMQELSRVLQSLADNRASAKVSFYYVDSDGITMRTGSVLVDHGVRAYIDHRQLAPQAAVDDILGLKLVKIASLQMDQVHPNPALIEIDLGTLITVLHAAPPPSVPVPTPAPPSPESAMHATATSTEFPAVAQPQIDIAAEAQRLLEPLFGVGTRKKIDEFAKVHPPAENPTGFLLLCQKQCGIMLGSSKAEALFRPLYDRLASDHLQRRR